MDNDNLYNKIDVITMYKDLQNRKINSELISRNDESHLYLNETNRIKFYKKVSLFLKKHLKKESK